MTLQADLVAIGVSAPGLVGWPATCAVLRGEQPRSGSASPPRKTSLLTANERRRATPLIHLALCAAEECLARANIADSMPSVFASSGGDMGNLHGLCDQLSRDAKGISPTAFHNSVHNAVAGYFSIGTNNRSPSQSLSAHDDTFIVGLREAMAIVACESSPVLLVCYDAVAPEPLFAKRPIAPDFAVAFVLTPIATATDALARLDLRISDEQIDPTRLPESMLEHMRLGNPAARCLPLLLALATGTDVTLSFSEGALHWRLGATVLERRHAVA